MTDYVWCHGPSCHKRPTISRVRGSKGSKVLRTMKVKQDRVSIWKYFCDQSCLMDFITEHVEQFVQLHPRREALETPIEDPKKEAKVMAGAEAKTQTAGSAADNPGAAAAAGAVATAAQTEGTVTAVLCGMGFMLFAMIVYDCFIRPPTKAQNYVV